MTFLIMGVSMFWSKRVVAVLLAVAGLSFWARPAQAQGWFGRSLVGWRAVGWRQYAGGGQLPGGQIVGAVSFTDRTQQAGPFTVEQWQQLVAAQKQQTPVFTVPQWQQLVAAQRQQPPTALTRPGPSLPPSPLAADQQWQQRNAPPRPPANGK
jgi:hypothetical protein